MAKGDIVRTKVPVPELVYVKVASGDTAVPGDAIGFNGDGNIQRATEGMAGPIKILTHLQKDDNNSKAYLLSGEIEAGAVLTPNTFVISDNTGKLKPGATTLFDKVIGIYLRLRSDEEGNPSDAAVNGAIIVRVIP